MIERSFLNTYQLELSLVLLFLVIINIVFIYLYKYSELINKRTTFLTLFTLNLIILGTIVSAYIVLKPKPIEKRVMIIPEFTTSESSNNQLLLVANQIEQNLRNSNQRDVLFMSFWWIYDAVNNEYAHNTSVYNELAENANVDIIYRLKKTENGMTLTGNNIDHDIKFSNTSEVFEVTKSVILVISGNLNIEMPTKIRNYTNLKYIEALQYYYQGNFEKLFEMANTTEINEQTMLQNIVISRAYSQNGAKIKENVNLENPYHNQEYLRNFVNAQKRIFVYVNKDPLNPDLYLPLIELQLFQENYDDADAGIKGYLTDFGEVKILRRSEPEIYLLYSYLNKNKFLKDGFRTRLDLIKESLSINPFLEKALRRYMKIILQNENISSENVSSLFDDLENYVQLNSYSDSAKFILADAYLERGEMIKSRRIYLDLYDKYKTKSSLHYGLGVTNFRISRRFDVYQSYVPEYKSAEDARNEAIKNFKTAISIGDDLNAYLYLGVIYSDLGDYDNAIKYYRLRIKNKIGEVDRYAEEAKKGLRKIFEDSTILRKYLEKENMLRDDVQFNN